MKEFGALLDCLEARKQIFVDFGAFVIIMLIKPVHSRFLLEWRSKPWLPVHQSFELISIHVFCSRRGEFLLRSLLDQVFFIALAELDIQVKELLFIHHIKAAEDCQVLRGQVKGIGAENFLSSLALHVSLFLERLAFLQVG